MPRAGWTRGAGRSRGDFCNDVLSFGKDVAKHGAPGNFDLAAKYDPKKKHASFNDAALAGLIHEAHGSG
jgi:hypothetical protein